MKEEEEQGGEQFPIHNSARRRPRHTSANTGKGPLLAIVERETDHYCAREKKENRRCRVLGKRPKREVSATVHYRPFDSAQTEKG